VLGKQKYADANNEKKLQAEKRIQWIPQK